MPYRPRRTQAEMRRDDEARKREGLHDATSGRVTRGQIIEDTPENRRDAYAKAEARAKAEEARKRREHAEEEANNARIREQMLRGKRGRPEEK